MNAHISGYISPGTTLESLKQQQSKHGTGYLDLIHKERKEEYKVTKVVYVQAGDEHVSEDLAACINGVLRETNSKTLQLYGMLKALHTLYI